MFLLDYAACRAQYATSLVTEAWHKSTGVLTTGCGTGVRDCQMGLGKIEQRPMLQVSVTKQFVWILRLACRKTAHSRPYICCQNLNQHTPSSCGLTAGSIVISQSELLARRKVFSCVLPRVPDPAVYPDNGFQNTASLMTGHRCVRRWQSHHPR